MYSSELIKGNLRTIVLKLLSSEGKMYGYEITQNVKLLSDDKIMITEGALYPTLHSLEAEGAVTTEAEFIGKRVRKYYTLTSAGKGIMNERVNEFSEFIKTMKVILDLKPAI